MSGVVRSLDGMAVELVIEGELARPVAADGGRAVVRVLLSPVQSVALGRRLHAASAEIERPSDPLGWGGRAP